MKSNYSNLLLQTGAATSGLCSVQVVPKDWLTANPGIDFNTGKVLSAIALAAGRDWITLDFMPLSYEYDEKPKSSKPGSFYEVSVTGRLNNYDATVQQVVETLRYHELVAIVKDNTKQRKVAGSLDGGLTLSFSNKKVNTSGGQETIQLEMVMECEMLPPFYAAP